MMSCLETKAQGKEQEGEDVHGYGVHYACRDPVFQEVPDYGN